MILLRKTTINDAPWKILFSALFLSFIGLIALNSISHQNTSIIQNPFYKQLFFLFSLCEKCFNLAKLNNSNGFVM